MHPKEPMPDKAYFEAAKEVAREALCLRDKCGAVVVLGKKIIGQGHNGPAGAHEYCSVDIKTSIKPKSDRTCCVHAEWRAILQATRSNEPLSEAVLYFSRIGGDGMFLKSGEPYCTVCSRLALDAGIGFFALWQEEGMKIWTTEEYNKLSYDFHLKNTL